VLNPTVQRRIQRDVKTGVSKHLEAIVRPVHPVVLRAFTRNAEQAIVSGQKAQVHQAFDGRQLGRRVALQQHLAAVGAWHQHTQLLPGPPAHVALVVKAQLRGDEAHVCHRMGQRRRQVQARHGRHPLQPREGAQHRRKRQQPAHAAGHIGMVLLQGRGAECRRPEQHGDLRRAQALGVHRAADALAGIQIQGRVVVAQRC
jgi:hypothetical protein